MLSQISRSMSIYVFSALQESRRPNVFELSGPSLFSPALVPPCLDGPIHEEPGPLGPTSSTPCSLRAGEVLGRIQIEAPSASLAPESGISEDA